MAIIKVANTGLDALPSQVEMLDVLTFDGSQSYSLTKDSVAFTPASADSILVSVNGIVQSGENFTVTGSTIDFGEAIPSTSVCDFIFQLGTGVLNTPVDNSVTTAKIVDGAVSSAKMFSGFANGITMADQWRLTTTTNTGSNSDITTNWERVDNANWSGIGTGLTESSGIFSFPQTGIYLITANFQVITQSDAAAGTSLLTTPDNSTYTIDARGYAGNDSSLSNYGMSTFESYFDVTNISTHKIKFKTDSFHSSTRLTGSTTISASGFTVIRLGDT